MKESDKKRLTEYLGECWDADKRPGGDLPNRTFTDPADFFAVFDKLVEKGDLPRVAQFTWTDHIDKIGARHPDLSTFLKQFHSRTESGEFRLCQLVAEWLVMKGR